MERWISDDTNKLIYLVFSLLYIYLRIRHQASKEEQFQ